MRSFFASSPFVRPGFVVEAAIIARPASFEMGISAFATFELNGPNIASTLESETNVFTFCAPCAGSCAPATASSSASACSLNAPNTWCALASSIASMAPCCVGMPCAASPPLTGRSMPILMTCTFCAEAGVSSATGVVEATSAPSTTATESRTNAFRECIKINLRISGLASRKKDETESNLCTPRGEASLPRRGGAGRSYVPMSSRTAAALKYDASGWWITIAAVDCSGTIWNASVSLTPSDRSTSSNCQTIACCERSGHAP